MEKIYGNVSESECKLKIKYLTYFKASTTHTLVCVWHIYLCDALVPEGPHISLAAIVGATFSSTLSHNKHLAF